ncbi:MAG: CBS domain-containing protein [Nanoarchaeota archaeon]
MNISLDKIKQIRKSLGLTQGELAQRAQVSQSLIAKIEAGRLDPTYSNAKKIFNALEELSKKDEIKAEEVMTHKVIFVSSGDDIKEAIEKMKKHNISQVPVLDEDKSVGLVSESSILSAYEKKSKKIKDIMEDAPPVISKNTSLSVFSDLLRFYSLIIVSDQGKLKGVITKSDLLAKMFK